MTPASIFARLVARLRPTASDTQDIAANCHPTSKGGAGLVSIIAPTRNSDGLPQPGLSLETIIHRRAVRLCNRNSKAVAAYVHRQTILSRGN